METSSTNMHEEGVRKPEPHDLREDIFRQHLNRSIKAVLIAEAPGVLSGLDHCRDLAELLDLAFETEVRDGHEITRHAVIARVSGNPVQISKGEDLLLGALSKASGIASAARKAKAMVGSRCRLVSGGFKKMPIEIKSVLRRAVADGGLEVRMLDQPFLYLDKNYVRIFGGVSLAMQAVAPLERPTVIQVRGEIRPIDEEAVDAARGGAAVIMVDTGDRADLRTVVEALNRNHLRSSVQVAFSGNIDLNDIEELCSSDVDALDIGYAIVDAPCLPIRFDVIA